MTKLNEIELDSIKGGTNVTGPVINAIVNVIKILQEAGYSLGSGIRRIVEIILIYLFGKINTTTHIQKRLNRLSSILMMIARKNWIR